MKKLYTLALAVLCACLTAGAAPRELSNDVVLPSKNRIERPSKRAFQPGNLHAKAVMAAEDEPASIFGDFEWYYTSAIGGGGEGQSVAQIFPSEIEQDSIVIIFDYDFGVVAGYDEATGKISIPANQYVGPFNTTQGIIETYFYHAQIDEAGENFVIVDTPVEATFDGYEMVFDENDFIAFGNATLGGYFMFTGYNYLVPAVDDWKDDMPEEGWEFHSYSTFVDAWMMMGVLGIDPAEMPYEVVVERNVDFDGLYRIVNPYGESSPLYEVNVNTSGVGYIVFSVADPDFVTVQPLVYSGLNDGYDQFLCTNAEGFYSILGGASKEDIIAALGSVSNYDAETQQVTFRNAAFSTKNAPDELYGWSEEPSEGSLTFTAFTGVNSVTVGGNATPVYYNLQGMRVENPAFGQVLIKQQDGKAVKVKIAR